MAKLTLEGFKNFFKYYNSEEHQIRAIETLYMDIPPELLDEQSDWIKQYRKQDQPEVEADVPKWPITKAEMAEIMQCSVSSLPDSLMDDFAKCAELYGMNRKNIAYFLGQCGHESAGLRYPVEIADGSAY